MTGTSGTAGSRGPRTHAIIGAAMEVHRELGCGFLEAVYQESLALEFTARQLPYSRELVLPVRYKSELLQVGYRVDFLCFESIIVELTGQCELTSVDDAQLLNYLKATRMQTGLLLNFGTSSLQWKRLVSSAHWTAE